MHQALTRALIGLILLASATLDASGHTTLLGGVSVSGIASAGLATLAWAWVIDSGTSWRVLRVTSPILLYAAWNVLSFFWVEKISIASFQNTIVPALFAAVVLISATAARSDVGFQDSCVKWLQWAIWLAMLLWCVNLLWPFLGPRSFAMFALLGFVWHVANWRYGARSSLLIAILLYVLLFFTLSRTAIVVATLMFPVVRFYRPRSLVSALRLAGLGAACTAILVYAIFNFEPLQRRFFTGDTSIQVASMEINTMGRINTWKAVWNSYLDSPWIGYGAGSAREVSGDLDHPHNDYLRILHDYGLVGAVAWLLGITCLGRVAYRSWRETVDPRTARIHLAALASLVAISLVMLTDNCLVYWFAMAPLGVLLGTSLGLNSVKGVLSSAEWPLMLAKAAPHLFAGSGAKERTFASPLDP